MDGPVRTGAHVLDPARGTLTRDGAPVHLRAKSFALLVHLARHRDRVVGKEELLDRIWPDVTVTEDSLTQAIGDLRRTLGDGAVRTDPRRGYQRAAAEVAAPPPAVGAVRLPVLAILPVLTRSADPQDGFLIDALVEEIIQGAGGYGLLQVIARHSVFQFRPETVPPQEAAARLGADWFVEGTARRIGGVLRLSLALCETATGRQHWAETLDLPERDWTQPIGAIPHRVVTSLLKREERALALRPVPSPSADLGAWQHFVAGMRLLRSYGAGVNEAARDHFLAAIRHDPGFALTHAYLGLAEGIIAGLNTAVPDALAAALGHALRGAALAPTEGRCLAIVAMIRLWRREFAAAEIVARRAVAVNPSDADLRCELGYVLTMRGKAEEALALIRDAFALNPLHPDWYHGDLALALQILGRHAEAISLLECIPDRTAWKETQLAACYAATGDARGARTSLDAARVRAPDWDVAGEARASRQLERPEDRAAFVAFVEQAVALAATVA